MPTWLFAFGLAGSEPREQCFDEECAVSCNPCVLPVCAVPKSRNAAALPAHSCNSDERNRKEICGISARTGVERAAFTSGPDEKYGIRDTALLCLLYDSGARVQELIDLSLLDIRLETPATIRLYGKGRKVRVVPLMSQTATILQKYLNMWHLDAARKPDDPVFVNHQGKRLTRPGVTYILNKYMAQVSWMEDKKGITPHVIRHSKAMHLLRADVDLHYIRDFLGHVQIETTEVYARADAEMKRKALETANLDLPAEPQTSWQKDQSLLSWLQSL